MCWNGSRAWVISSDLISQYLALLTYDFFRLKALSRLSLINLLCPIWCRKVGWPRRARVVGASLRTNKAIAKTTQEIVTWKRLDDSKMSRIDPQILYNANARRWTFGMKSAGAVMSPLLLILLTLVITACSSCLFNTLYAKYRRKVGIDEYSRVTEDIPLESNYPIDSDNSDDDWPGFSVHSLVKLLYIANFEARALELEVKCIQVTRDYVYVPLVVPSSSLTDNCLLSKEAVVCYLNSENLGRSKRFQRIE